VSDERPIGVLVGDAGSLDVVARLRAALPKEDLVVTSDDSHGPYAALRGDVVARRLARLGAELVEQGAKLVLVGSLQGSLDGAPVLPVPVLTLEAVLQGAARASGAGVVAAVCGEGCVRGGSYARSVRRLRGGSGVVVQEWAGLRDGVLSPAAVAERAQAAGAGAIALVCGHASRLAGPLADGPLPVVDAADVAARRVRHLLAAGDGLARRRRPGRTILSSSAPTRVQSELAAFSSRNGPGR
jgi:glutamate racemase